MAQAPLLIADAVHANLPDNLKVSWPVEKIANHFLLVGLSGKKGSGKTSVADRVQQFRIPAFSTIQMGFATALKRAVDGLLPPETRIHPGVQTDQEFKKLPSGFLNAEGVPQTVRDIYCWLGMAARALSPDFWVQAFHNRLVEELVDHISLGRKPLLILVPDVRFWNEFEYIRQNAGITCRMALPPNYVHGPEHESETELDNCHEFYINFETQFKSWAGPEYLSVVAAGIAATAVAELASRRQNIRVFS